MRLDAPTQNLPIVMVRQDALCVTGWPVGTGPILLAGRDRPCRQSMLLSRIQLVWNFSPRRPGGKPPVLHRLLCWQPGIAFRSFSQVRCGMLRRVFRSDASTKLRYTSIYASCDSRGARSGVRSVRSLNSCFLNTESVPCVKCLLRPFVALVALP